MNEQGRDNQKQVKTKRRMRLFRPIPTIVFLLACCVLLWFFIFYETPYKRLTAIEEARAIPDSENAAILYYKLPQYDSDLLEYDFPDESIEDATLARPWSSEDYPELAGWFEEREDIIEGLIEVSKIEQCRFPVTDFPKGTGLHYQRLESMRAWTFFLIRSANNDIAEGRIDKVLEKCFCLIRIGRHNRRQSFSLDFLTGIYIESMSLRRMRTCIVESDLTDENLQVIETGMSQSTNEWTKDWDNMMVVEKLHTQMLPQTYPDPGWRYKLKEWWEKRRNHKDKINELKEKYIRLLCDRRANFILIALRESRDQTGRWPESLDQIKSSLAKDILIDPQNNGPFVYKLTGDGFILYSKGPNNIDENGTDINEADDRAIWPLQITQENDITSTTE